MVAYLLRGLFACADCRPPCTLTVNGLHQSTLQYRDSNQIWLVLTTPFESVGLWIQSGFGFGSELANECAAAQEQQGVLFIKTRFQHPANMFPSLLAKILKQRGA